MPVSSKKVIVRLLAGGQMSGYLPATSLLHRGVDPGAGALDRPDFLDLLDLAGRSRPVPLPEVKYVAFVRDFNVDDPANPERLSRRTFLARPRSEGLWLRVTFASGEQLEGLAPLDATLLDALVVDAGLFLTPPDERSNTHRMYVPRAAVAEVDFLAVVRTRARVRPAEGADPQTSLFPVG